MGLYSEEKVTAAPHNSPRFLPVCPASLLSPLDTDTDTPQTEPCCQAQSSEELMK